MEFEDTVCFLEITPLQVCYVTSWEGLYQMRSKVLSDNLDIILSDCLHLFIEYYNLDPSS